MVAPTGIGRAAPVVRAALALGLAGTWLVAAGLPAHAAAGPDLIAPASGERIAEAVTISAGVFADPFEEIQTVEARLVRDGEVVGSAVPMEMVDGTARGGESQWETSLDPLAAWPADGAVLANGPGRIEVRARSERPGGIRERTEWRGHEVVFEAAPPPATVTADVLEGDRGSVALEWESPAIPDFIRFVVQRADGGGAFQTIEMFDDPGADRYLDTPGPGGWTYRVVTVRTGASSGSELAAVSDTATADVAEDGSDAGDPDAGPAEDGDEGETSDDVADEDERGEESASGSGAAAGPLTQGDAPPAPQGEASVPQIQPGQAPPTAPAEAPQPTPTPQLSTAPPPEQDEGFSEVLPFAGEQEITERTELQVPGEVRRDSQLALHASEELALERLMVPVASGLLLVVAGGHVLRLARQP